MQSDRKTCKEVAPLRTRQTEYVKDSDSGIIVSTKLAQRLPAIGNNPEWCSMFVKIQPFYTPITLLFQLVPLSLAPPRTLLWWGGTFAQT